MKEGTKPNLELQLTLQRPITEANDSPNKVTNHPQNLSHIGYHLDQAIQTCHCNKYIQSPAAVRYSCSQASAINTTAETQSQARHVYPRTQPFQHS